MEKSFQTIIMDYLTEKYQDNAEQLYTLSHLLQYLVKKTVSANKQTKARSSFANLYAIYVLVKDYLEQDFDKNNKYKMYEGAKYSYLITKQKELPFGKSLQNHALNNRLNDEFFKFFPMMKEEHKYPIIRNLTSKRYWINENYLKIKINQEIFNIAPDVVYIIDKYISVKQKNLSQFIEQCKELQNIECKSDSEVLDFIISLLAYDVDARLFEIVSFAILKYYFSDTKIFWGYTKDQLNEDFLHLYKTGRTNANDGGIDFVMKPLGKFFQVTESLDFKKYFLDIEKVEKYPISFVIKSEDSKDIIYQKIKTEAIKNYVIESVVDDYLNCIEDIINIPFLKNCLHELNNKALISKVLEEIIRQSKVEFNYDDGMAD